MLLKWNDLIGWNGFFFVFSTKKADCESETSKYGKVLFRPIVLSFLGRFVYEREKLRGSRDRVSYFIAQPPSWLYTCFLWFHVFKLGCSLIIVDKL